MTESLAIPGIYCPHDGTTIAWLIYNDDAMPAEFTARCDAGHHFNPEALALLANIEIAGHLNRIANTLADDTIHTFTHICTEVHAEEGESA